MIYDATATGHAFHVAHRVSARVRFCAVYYLGVFLSPSRPAANCRHPSKSNITQSTASQRTGWVLCSWPCALILRISSFSGQAGVIMAPIGRAIILLSSIFRAQAWVSSPYLPATRVHRPLSMAIDYNDPIVAEEFALVQPMDFDDVEIELQEQGIRVPASMNEMDVKLMLVEVRLRSSGKLKGTTEKKKRPDKFASKFEEAMWTKPAFNEFYETLREKDDHNAQNVVAEYVNDKDLALQRYGKDYKALIRKADEALNAPPPVKSPTLIFSGFPANMGEAACKMTLESLGTVVEFECAADDEFPVLRGKVTYEDIEDAKKAVAQYDGMDMGMGTKLELASV